MYFANHLKREINRRDDESNIIPSKDFIEKSPPFILLKILKSYLLGHLIDRLPFETF
jgi:hypothetical protein